MTAAKLPETGTLKPLVKVVEERLGKRFAPSTCWRWATKGALVRSRRIKLKCWKVGNAWYTTDEAFDEFVQAQTERAVSTDLSEDDTSERSESTERRLQEAGLLDRPRRPCQRSKPRRCKEQEDDTTD
jgi:hypothetical protein